VLFQRNSTQVLLEKWMLLFFFNLNTVIILSILPPDSVDATGQPGKSTLLLI